MELHTSHNILHIALTNRELKKLRRGDIQIDHRHGQYVISIKNTVALKKAVLKKHNNSIITKILKFICK